MAHHKKHDKKSSKPNKYAIPLSNPKTDKGHKKHEKKHESKHEKKHESSHVKKREGKHESKHHGYGEDRRVPPSVGGMGGKKERKAAEIEYLKHKGKKLNKSQKKFVKKEKAAAKKEKASDTASQKIKSGNKYTRLQRFPTLSPDQKKILKDFKRPQPREHFTQPAEMTRALDFFNRGMENGPPQSPVQRAGEQFLQRGLEGGIPTSPIEAQAQQFLGRGMENGPPVSPMETSGQNFLQNLLANAPAGQLRDFEAPYMRQFYEQTVPEIAERFTGQDAQRSSAFAQTMGAAGAGLQENLASLKGKLINELLGQQLQGANVGLGYAQLPGQRYQAQQQNANIGLGYAQLPGSRYQMQQQNANLGLGYSQLPGQKFNQQMQAAQLAIPTSLIPQERQQEMNRYATNADFQRQQQILGTQPWGQIGVPPRGRSPSFWQQAAPRIGSAIMGGIAGAPLGPWGMAAGALGGGLAGAPPPISIRGGSGGGGVNRIMESAQNNL